MLESRLHRALRDFVKGHAANACFVANVICLLLGGLLALLLARILAQFIGKMGGDGLAFAIRIGRK